MLANIYLYVKYKDKIKNLLLISCLIAAINIIVFNIVNFRDYIAISTLICASIIDIKDRIIPNFFIFILIFASINLYIPSLGVYDFMTVFVLVLLILTAFLTNSIGMGDVKLFITLYFLKGAIFFSRMTFILSFLMFAFSIVLIIYKRNFKTSFPLIPLILVSYILARGLF